MRHCSQALVAAVMLWALSIFSPNDPAAQELEGEKLLNARCAACHLRSPDGGLNRISNSRRTPEGWDMTLVRMVLVHGVKLTPKERRTLVKHLADTRGLAPSETRNWRYILERRPNMVETPEDEELSVMCARCHSYARIAIQRREEEDWRKLSHFHLGQFPTIEYQALGRDRNWWEIASTRVPERLAELYPLKTSAWTDWQRHKKADLSGSWRLVGHRPGVGPYQGTASTKKSGNDSYSLKMNFSYADGTRVEGSGKAIVYTGYEWRGRLKMGEDSIMQVFTVSEDGTRLSGRWFLENADAIGGDLTAVRMDPDSPAQIMAIVPAYLKSGSTAQIAIHGVGLRGDVSLGEGVSIGKTVSQSAETVVVEATAKADAIGGKRVVTVGEVQTPELFTVYPRVESVRVEPDYAIARVGDQEGPLPPVPAQFDAVAYLNGPDGKAGTEDDLRIGVMPASWSVENFNELAAEMDDVKFAGAMQADGLFMPAGAGPNPERRYQTNNVGDLTVKAIVTDADKELEGKGHLIVTVQRWNDPPIR